MAKVKKARSKTRRWRDQFGADENYTAIAY